MMTKRDFIAKAAIEIMAHLCAKIEVDDFTQEDKNGNIIGPGYNVKEAAENSLTCAKALAEVLEEDYAYKHRNDFFEEDEEEVEG